MGKEGEFVWCRAKSPPTRFLLNEDIFPNYWENNTQENDFVFATLPDPYGEENRITLNTAAFATSTKMRLACMVKPNKHLYIFKLKWCILFRFLWELSVHLVPKIKL